MHQPTSNGQQYPSEKRSLLSHQEFWRGYSDIELCFSFFFRNTSDHSSCGHTLVVSRKNFLIQNDRIYMCAFSIDEPKTTVTFQFFPLKTQCFCRMTVSDHYSTSQDKKVLLNMVVYP